MRGERNWPTTRTINQARFMIHEPTRLDHKSFPLLLIPSCEISIPIGERILSYRRWVISGRVYFSRRVIRYPHFIQISMRQSQRKPHIKRIRWQRGGILRHRCQTKGWLLSFFAPNLPFRNKEPDDRKGPSKRENVPEELASKLSTHICSPLAISLTTAYRPARVPSPNDAIVIYLSPFQYSKTYPIQTIISPA